MFKIRVNYELPHKKSRKLQFEFVKMLHKEIDKLEQIEMFDKAIVSIIICLPSISTKNKVWDVDNRAINLVLNNLKGIFFADDDYSHVSLFVGGKEGWDAETIILIDSLKDPTKIMEETIIFLKSYKNSYGLYKVNVE